MNNPQKVLGTLVILLVGVVFLISLVSSIYSQEHTIYSNPKYNNGSEINWEKVITDKPTSIIYNAKEISRDEWNKVFEDYRNGDISKEKASSILKGVSIEW